MVTQQLATLEEATRMLGECRTIDEAKKVRDLAAAYQVYAREAELGFEAQSYGAEIKLRAERRCGEVLAEMAANGARSTGGKPSSPATVTRESLGVTPDESSQWQRLAKAEPEAFEAYIAETKQSGRFPTTAGAVRTLSPSEAREKEDRAAELFTIYRALEALASFPMTPKRWAKLDHGSSRYRVDDNLEAAGKWIDELRETWQTI